MRELRHTHDMGFHATAQRMGKYTVREGSPGFVVMPKRIQSSV